MEDKPTEMPERPEGMHRDLLLTNVHSATAHVLEGWLKEKAQQAENIMTPSDIFSIKIDQLLNSELGVEEVKKRYKKYHDEQKHLRGAFIRYCEKTGFDPDVEAYAKAYPEKDIDPDSGLSL